MLEVVRQQCGPEKKERERERERERESCSQRQMGAKLWGRAADLQWAADFLAVTGLRAKHSHHIERMCIFRYMTPTTVPSELVFFLNIFLYARL